jgi:hypothetical protein
MVTCSTWDIATKIGPVRPRKKNGSARLGWTRTWVGWRLEQNGGEPGRRKPRGSNANARSSRRPSPAAPPPPEVLASAKEPFKGPVRFTQGGACTHTSLAGREGETHNEMRGDRQPRTCREIWDRETSMGTAVDQATTTHQVQGKGAPQKRAPATALPPPCLQGGIKKETNAVPATKRVQHLEQGA